MRPGALVAALAWLAVAGALRKYATRVVRTKYGPLRGVVALAQPHVEAYLGVPYATPPLGSLRYMPPVTPSTWRTARVADAAGAPCPQRAPRVPDRADALLQHPRARVRQLQRLAPLLANQSEDCLYVNLYVPRIGPDSGESTPESGAGGLPCLVLVHGESYEWGTGNTYDGTMLAAHGNIIVVTVNFRLGILGFLKTGSKSSAQGNFGLMDLVAGLHWLRENLPAFGGDPERVTLMGHGTGAALANFLAVSPVSKELLKRVILFSGSGLSSWSLQREPLLVKRKVAEQTGCHGDLLEDDLAPCLRNKPLAELLSVTLDPPRFLPGFAPFVDGSVLLNPSQAGPPPGDTGRAAAVASAAGYELADFADKELLFGLTTTESYLELNAQDLEFGFNETRRDRILRTFVRNVYYYHLNEIYSTLKNEYTDWDKPVQNPLSVRDATLEVLSDGRTAAPLVRLGYLHALRGGATYFAQFQHLSSERDYPQRGGSVHGEDLPYCLGAPLVGGMPYLPYNYTQQDQHISIMVMKYIANFVRSGNPNKKVGPPHQRERPPPSNDLEGEEEALPFWDTYDTINQLYLELNSKPEMRSHYRGHKMSLWLSLIPQLHRPGSELPDFSMRHHHFQEEGANFYEGPVRPQSMQRPSLPQVKPWDGAGSTSGPPAPPRAPAAPPAALAPTTDCPPNATARPPATGADDSLLRRLASAHYQSYTAALTVTIAVGCFLLLLNVLIFAGIYHQRGSRARRADRDLGDHGSCSSSSENYDAKALNFDTRAFELESGFGYDCKAASYLVKTGSKYDLKTFPSECAIPSFGEYSCYDEKNLAAQYEKRSLADVSLCSLPDVSASGGGATGGGSVVRIDTQPPDIQRVRASGDSRTSSFREAAEGGVVGVDGASGAGGTEAPAGVGAPPPAAEPPPDESASGAAPRTMVSVGAQADPPPSILRQAAPNPPSIMKKRVQIQEISV